MTEPDVFDLFTVTLNVVIRPCRREDLADLEWFGMFSEHSEIIRETFAQQERGEALMLIAEANGFPVGQVWINLVLKSAESTGALWAVRVFPLFQSQGIGTRLIVAAEQVLAQQGFRAVELGVEKDNPGARRFYERHGYSVVATAEGAYSYLTPEGERIQVPVDEWILRKELTEGI